MVVVAQLLHIRMPGSYEVAFSPSPGRAGASGPGKEPVQPGTGPPAHMYYIYFHT